MARLFKILGEDNSCDSLLTEIPTLILQESHGGAETFLVIKCLAILFKGCQSSRMVLYCRFSYDLSVL